MFRGALNEIRLNRIKHIYSPVQTARLKLQNPVIQRVTGFFVLKGTTMGTTFNH
jgi:hypothetical protein